MKQLQMSLVTHLNWHVPVGELYQLYFAQICLDYTEFCQIRIRKHGISWKSNQQKNKENEETNWDPLYEHRLEGAIQWKDRRKRPNLSCLRWRWSRRNAKEWQGKQRAEEERSDPLGAPPPHLRLTTRRLRRATTSRSSECCEAGVCWGVWGGRGLEGRHASLPINSRHIHDFDSRGDFWRRGDWALALLSAQICWASHWRETCRLVGSYINPSRHRRRWLHCRSWLFRSTATLAVSHA